MSPYETVIIDRIQVLLGYRRWYRRVMLTPERRAFWKPLDDEYKSELRMLVKLAREARRIEAARPDPMDVAKSYAEWTENELAGAWGR